MDTKTTTLFGSRVLPVKRSDGTDGEVTIRQILLKEYPAALKLMDDELALVALACGLTTPALQELSPASYNAVYKAVQEVNAEGFFPYAARQADRAAQALRNLPPEMVEKLISSKLSAATPPVAR